MLASQCRMARAALEFTVQELAEKAGVPKDRILGVEAGEKIKSGTVAKVQAALEAAGVEFTRDGFPGVRLHESGIARVSPALPAERRVVGPGGWLD